MPVERMATDLLPIVREWQPDVVVREPMEFGGPLVAEHLGLPHAVAGALWFLTDDFEASIGRVGSRLPALRRTYGLPPEADATMAYRYLTLAAMPRDWPAADEPVPPTAHFFRPDPYAVAAETLPAWVAALPTQPTVHATLGTLFNQTPGLYAAIIAALRDEPVNLVVAVGRDQEPAAFGPQPPNVRIERFIPHTALLPHCDLVVTHGGYGTLMATLRQGLPVVVLPIMGDQPRNAQRCADLGAGRVVGPEDRIPEAIRAAVRAVLTDPAYRQNAGRLRDELAALPGPEYAVSLLERLAAERQPIVAAG
jgi:MGT family glycosyltransferase